MWTEAHGDAGKPRIRFFDCAIAACPACGLRSVKPLLLSGMDDDALMRVWAATRVLDADFGRKNRAAVMELELNSLRAELEPSWEEDVEPELTC